MTDISNHMRNMDKAAQAILIKEAMSIMGRKGGSNRSRSKVAAGRRNIRKAWIGRSEQARRARRAAGK
jgi:hypothetical protein